MTFPRRAFSRSLVAKLSDVRERLYDLLERADAERAHDNDGFVGACELEDTSTFNEVSRG